VLAGGLETETRVICRVPEDHHRAAAEFAGAAKAVPDGFRA
jgi:hypothetical protein